MIQRLLILLILPLFLTACSSDSDSAANPDGGGGNLPVLATTTAPSSTVEYEDESSFDNAISNKTLIFSAVAMNVNEDSTTEDEGNNSSLSELIDFNVAQVSGSAVSIKFDDSGNMSEAILYLGSDKQTLSGTDIVTGTATSLSAAASLAGTGKTTDVKIDRQFSNHQGSNTFTADYMMGVNWYAYTSIVSSSNDKITDNSKVNRYMLFGFETEDNNIPTNSGASVMFKGYGIGNTYTKDPAEAGEYTTEDVSFDISADVDFSAREVEVATNNTIDAESSTTIAFDWLNFTSTLTYDAGKNNISGKVSADGMNGNINARFYGLGEDAAQELGGSFAMQKNDSEGYNLYYIGYFGTQCTQGCNSFTYGGDTSGGGGIVHPDGSLGKISANAIVANQGGDHSLTAIGVQTKGSGFDNIDSALSLTFGASGTMSASSFDVDGVTYAVDTSTYTNYVQLSDERIYGTSGIGSAATNEYSRFWVSRDFNDSSEANDSYANGYDFVSEYMVSVIWDNGNAIDNNEGYLVAGFETAGGDIPKSGTATFTGNGEGFYSDGEDTEAVDFDAKADVTFSSRAVDLTVSNAFNFNGGNDNDELATFSEIDFTAALSYAENTNSIRNAAGVELTVGSNTLEAVAGDIQARFYGYGTGDYAAQELGGTFKFAGIGTSAYYYGFFGATTATGAARGGGSSSISVPPSSSGGGGGGSISVVPTLATLGYASFTAASDDTAEAGNKTLVLRNLAVGADIASDYAKQNDDSYLAVGSQTIAVADIDADAFAITFEVGTVGQINATMDAPTLYIGGKTYIGQNDNAAGTYFNGTIAGSEDDSSKFNVNQEFANDTSTLDATYMANIYWSESLSSFNDDQTTLTTTIGHNYMVAGFETAGDDIPAPVSAEGAVSFTGYGNGIYVKTADSFHRDIAFNVNLDVDFFNESIDFTTNNTINTTGGGNGAVEDLDITTAQTLSYTEGENAITGTVDDTSNNNGMSGNVNARFYGPAAEEIGGTFNLKKADNSEYYYGFFGAKNTQ